MASNSSESTDAARTRLGITLPERPRSRSRPRIREPYICERAAPEAPELPCGVNPNNSHSTYLTWLQSTEPDRCHCIVDGERCERVLPYIAFKCDDCLADCRCTCSVCSRPPSSSGARNVHTTVDASGDVFVVENLTPAQTIERYGNVASIHPSPSAASSSRAAVEFEPPPEETQPMSLDSDVSEPVSPFISGTDSDYTRPDSAQSVSSG